MHTSQDATVLSDRNRTFDLSDIEKLKKEVLLTTRSLIYRFYPNCKMPLEDVAWDCFTTLYMRRFFHKYVSNESKTTTYLWYGVRNYLIDEERKAQGRVLTSSLDCSISKKSDLTLGDLLSDHAEEEVIAFQAFQELMSHINDDSFKKSDVLFTTNCLGTVSVSPYSVLYCFISGYKLRELSDLSGLSQPKIYEYYNAGVNLLKSRVRNVKSNEVYSILLNKVNKRDKTKKKCSYCGCYHTRLSTNDTFSGVSVYYCNDCKKTYTEFTNTPIQNFQHKERIKFVEFCRNLNDGLSFGESIKKCSLSFKKAMKWFNIKNDYFRGDPTSLQERILNRWHITTIEAIANKKARGY